MINASLVYPMFAIIVGLAAFIIIPKHLYKKYFLYGLIFGGFLDALLVLTGKVLNLFVYKGMGVFNVLGLYSIWTPITWTFIFMIFFYFLPVRKAFLYPYLISFTALNYATGLVMQNMGLFEYIGLYRYIAPLAFLAWYSLSAFIYIKREDIELIRL